MRTIKVDCNHERLWLFFFSLGTNENRRPRNGEKIFFPPFSVFVSLVCARSSRVMEEKEIAFFSSVPMTSCASVSFFSLCAIKIRWRAWHSLVHRDKDEGKATPRIGFATRPSNGVKKKNDRKTKEDDIGTQPFARCRTPFLPSAPRQSRAPTGFCRASPSPILPFGRCCSFFSTFFLSAPPQEKGAQSTEKEGPLAFCRRCRCSHLCAGHGIA